MSLINEKSINTSLVLALPLSLAPVLRLPLPLHVPLPLPPIALHATAVQAAPLTFPVLKTPPSDLLLDLSPLLIDCSLLKLLLLSHRSRELAGEPTVQSRAQQLGRDAESVGLSKNLFSSSSHLFLDLRDPGKLSPELADGGDAQGDCQILEKNCR